MRRAIRILAFLIVAIVLVLGGGWLYVHQLQQGALRLDYFDDEIAAFQAADREDPPASGGVVFIGSSSIRFWDSLADDMAPVPVVRRGFGGAHMAHVARAAPRIVIPYAPKAVVVYAGDNDLAAGTGKTSADVLRDFETLVDAVHAALPETRVLFVTIKPSTLRFDRWPEMQRANAAIAAFAAGDPRVEVIDVASPMLDAAGRPRDELFALDGLHLSEAGYAVWTEAMRPTVIAAWRADPAEPRP